MSIDPVLARGLDELGIREALERLPLDPQGNLLPYEERCRRWEAFKKLTKKRFRRLALELHPDANQNLPVDERTAKEERLKSLIKAVKSLEDIKPRPEPVRQPMATPFGMGFGVVIVVSGVSSNTTYSTTGSSYPFNTAGGFRRW